MPAALWSGRALMIFQYERLVPPQHGVEGIVSYAAELLLRSFAILTYATSQCLLQ
jgi:hypothetical protein